MYRLLSISLKVIELLAAKPTIYKLLKRSMPAKADEKSWLSREKSLLLILSDALKILLMTCHDLLQAQTIYEIRGIINL